MKIRLIFVAAAWSMLLSHRAFSQIEFGPKVGLNMATVKTTNFPNANNLDYSSIVGLSFGVYSRMNLNDKAHINGDFLISTKGYEIYGGKTTINYVELPILFSYTLLENFDVELGPDIGFKFDVNSNQGVMFKSITFIDFSATAGIRYELMNKVILSVRHYYGLSSIATFYRTTSEESVTFNRVTQFTIGYRLR